MKLSNEVHPISDLNASIFLKFVGTESGCPVLLNQISDKIKRMIHLVNTVSNNGTDRTAHDKKINRKKNSS